MVQCIEVLGQVQQDCPFVSLIPISAYLEDCVLGASPRPVAVAPVRKQRFIDWHQLLRYCLLYDPVFDAWYPQFPHASVRLRYLFSSHRIGFVLLA